MTGEVSVPAVDERSPVRGVWWGLVGTFAFSGTLPATRLTVGILEPVVVGLGREVVAGVLAGLVLVIAPAPRPTGPQWRWLAVVALAVVIGWPLLVTIALQRAPAIHGAVVVGVVPLFTSIFAVWIGRERLTRSFWALNATGVAAVLLYGIAEGAGMLSSADLLLLVAAVLCGVGFAVGGVLAVEIGATRVICWALVLSLPVVTPVVVWSAWSTGLPADPLAWSGFAYVALVSAFAGFFAWYHGLALGGVARIGQLQLLSPVLAGLWSATLLGEPVTAQAVLAACAVTICAFLIQHAPLRRSSCRSSP